MLTYRNNWEYHEYRIDGVLVKDISCVEIGGTPYEVTGEMISVPYNDMGNRYEATSRHFFVKIPFEAAEGGMMAVPLYKLDLTKVIPTQFTLRK